MKNKSIIPNIIGMIIISILLIFGASRCSGPVPQATAPDTAKDSATEQTVPETGAEEAETEGESAEPVEGETASAGEETAPVELSFLEVPEGEWFRDSVAYVFGKGLMNGVTEDTLVPQGEATRAQMATIIMRYDQQFGQADAGQQQE